MDINTIHFQSFQLSPGAGGQKHQTGWGGGGGGVLVDGSGPQNKTRDGQGYGGGQGGCSYSPGETCGSPAKGVVLMEIKNTNN